MENMNILYFVLIVVAIIALFMYFNQPSFYKNEGELTMNQDAGGDVEHAETEAGVENYKDRLSTRAYADAYLPNSSPEMTGQPTGVDSTCYPKDQLNPQELLPKDFSSTWAQCNPSGVGSLEGKNFLDAGHHIGINSVGQVLRNANRQIRSEPPNPQVVVSPFLQSTIQPDTNRRYFEIGNC